jgi:hypothetical protein
LQGSASTTRSPVRPIRPCWLSAGTLDLADETFRKYERVVDAKYLDQIWTEAKQFSTNRLSRQYGVAKCAIINFKNGQKTIKTRTLRKLTKAILDLQNKKQGQRVLN